MSYFRWGILLLIIVTLFIPKSDDGRLMIYSIAERTASDVGGFCSRNREVCDDVSSAFHGLLDRLNSATESIEDMLKDAGIGTGRHHSLETYSAIRNREQRLRGDFDSTATHSFRDDTLTGDDRRPNWRGPYE